MELSLRIFLAFCVLTYYILLAIMLKKRMLGLRYALIWILSGIGMLVFIIFPTIVFKASAIIGISNPVNAIFFLVMGFSIALLLSLTSIVSSLNEKNLRLTQALSLLEQRVHLLEGKLTKEQCDDKDQKIL